MEKYCITCSTHVKPSENANIFQINNFLDKMRLDVVDNAYNVDLVNLVHKRKIAVWLDVQSDDEGPAKWEQALKLGADGLQTDHPEKLIKYLEDQGKR
jgi:glycerophosphoryl diester phosphodiesterase